MKIFKVMDKVESVYTFGIIFEHRIKNYIVFTDFEDSKDFSITETTLEEMHKFLTQNNYKEFEKFDYIMLKKDFKKKLITIMYNEKMRLKNTKRTLEDEEKLLDMMDIREMINLDKEEY